MLTPRGSVLTSPESAGRRVLAVDDEARLRDVLVRILDNEGIRADSAPDANQALTMLRTTSYDLVILDLLMPGMDGFSLLSEIMASKPDQGVLVLSCLTDLDSKTAALGLGADDYLAKPFHVQELVARVQARLRSIARQGPAVLRHGRIALDVLRRQVDVGAGRIQLTSRECQLLWELMRQPGTVLSREELLARVWGCEPDSAANVIDVYIGRLRHHVGREAIVTVRGKGYRV